MIKKNTLLDKTQRQLLTQADAYLGHRQTFIMKLFEKIAAKFKPFTIFTKSFITDVWQGLHPLSTNPTKWSNTLKQLFKCV